MSLLRLHWLSNNSTIVSYSMENIDVSIKIHYRPKYNTKKSTAYIIFYNYLVINENTRMTPRMCILAIISALNEKVTMRSATNVT